MNNIKSPLSSKTFWVNVASLIGALSLIVDSHLLSDEHTRWALFAIAAINLIMRFFTGQPISRAGVKY